MRLAAILAAAATCLGLAGPTIAQDMLAAQPGYVLVADSGQATFFVHGDSIRYVGAFREVWTLQNYAGPEDLGGGHGPSFSSRVVERFDCAGWRSGVVETTDFALRGANGAIVYSTGTNNHPDMRHLAPGTVGAAKLDFVCARG